MMRRTLVFSATFLLAALLGGAPTIALAASGGPDDFGYTWLDNDPPVGECTYSFQDIVSSGAVIGTGDDAVFTNIPIGFTFNYYGTDYTTLNVSTNGFLALGSSGNSFANTCPQPVSLNDRQISVFWDDLNITGAASLRYETIGSAPNRTFIVQWDTVQFFGDPPPPSLTFQVQLHEGSNIIAFMYDDVEQSSQTLGNSATIGIDGPGSTNFLPTSCNTGTLSNGLARFFLPPGVQACGVGEPTPGRAAFTVNKNFSDGNIPTEVEVTINCFTGLPLTQSQTISESQGVEFVVTGFDEGELDCEITEEELLGYTPTYHPAGPGSHDSEGGCNFDNLEGNDNYSCHIVNVTDYVDVEIEKLWVIEGSGGDEVDTGYKLTLYCDALIDGGQESCQHGGSHEFPESLNGGYETCKKFYGEDSAVFTAQVKPHYPGSHCWVSERVYGDAVEVSNGCEDIDISAGTGDSCLITNTVFFEGIPTLSQYGLALLALLMLGVGVVGFRRLV